METAQSIDTVLQDPVLNSQYLQPGFLFDKVASFSVSLFHNISDFGLGGFFNGIFFALALFFITLLCYCAIRMFEIGAKEHNHLHHEIAEYAQRQREREAKMKEAQAVSQNPRWMKVLGHLSSSNPNDWKLGVIEADSMLDSLMKDMGFKGESLGERLKMADRDKFRSLTDAWEVHTIRNRIAHEGSAFELSSHEAKRVIALYQQIFREYGYI